MIDVDKLRLAIKNKYNLAVGELTLAELKRKVTKVSKAKIKVSGRSYKTGKRKTASFPKNDLQ